MPRRWWSIVTFALTAVAACGGLTRDPNGKRGGGPLEPTPAPAAPASPTSAPIGAAPPPACHRGDAPLVIASVSGGIVGTAVHGDFVYFVTDAPGPNSGVVARVPTRGGDVQVLAANEAQPLDVVVDDANVYFTTSSDVRAMPLAGGAPRVLAIEAGRGLAVDEAYVYIGHGLSGFGGIRRIGKGGDDVTALADAKRNTATLSLDDDNVYWEDEGHVMRVAKVGGDAVTVASGASQGSFAVDANAIYFGGVGRVTAHDRAHGSETPLAQGMILPRGRIATDARFLYVTNVGDEQLGHGSVLQIEKAGGAGALRVVAASQSSPWYPAVDDACVYWAAGGEVWRAPKLD